ncbi:MAG: TVP38/TMEM64 family protein [Myxococcales bacterium]|nr:TVP38/TMEM64 family protein [Myxococcales bacterium]
MLGALLLVGAAALAVRWALWEELDPKAALALLRSVQQRWWAAPAYLALYLGGTCLFLPAVLFHMVAGAAWGFPVASALNFVAVNGAANLQFLIGRRLGRERAQRLLRQTRLGALDERAARHGFRAMVAIRLLPLPFVGVNVAAGVSAIRWRDFALGSMVGSFPVMLVYTYFAASLVEGVAGAERDAMLHAAAAGVLVLLATFVPRLWSRTRFETRV